LLMAAMTAFAVLGPMQGSPPIVGRLLGGLRRRMRK